MVTVGRIQSICVPRGRRSREDIIALLREGAQSGRTGVGPNGFISSNLAGYVRKKFGSLPAAIEAAGLDPAQLLRAVHGRYSTDECIAAELRRLAQEHPEMTLSVINTKASDVARAARKRYGSVPAAISAAGISGWPRSTSLFPSRDAILAAIRDRHRRGESMTVKAVMSTERPLVKAAYRRLGTWRAAVRAAGLGGAVDNRGRAWGGTQIRAELNGRRLRGEALDGRAIRREDPRLWSAVIAYYGSLAKALRDADRTRRAAEPRSSSSGPSSRRRADSASARAWRETVLEIGQLDEAARVKRWRRGQKAAEERQQSLRSTSARSRRKP